MYKKVEREGQTQTFHKNNLEPSLYARWKKKYLAHGKVGLESAYKRADQVIRNLEEENDLLKKIITN